LGFDVGQRVFAVWSNFWCCFVENEKVTNRDIQCSGDTGTALDRRSVYASFDKTDKLHGIVSQFGESLLRKPSFTA